MGHTQSHDDMRQLRMKQVDEWETDPFNLAREFFDSEGSDEEGRPTIRFWRGEWYRYRDGHYRKYDVMGTRMRLTAFIKTYIDQNECVDRSGMALRVTTALVNNTLQALAPIAAVSDVVEMPTWLGEDRQGPFVAFRDGLLDLNDLSSTPLRVSASSPDWFSTVVFPYDYVEAAVCPEWIRSLDQVMEGDKERIALIQEWFGYCLTPDTSQHKFLVAEGEGANGKSVLLEILTKLLGEQNVSQVPLEMFATRFQLTRTIGKQANICAEVGEISTVAEGSLKQFTAADRMYFDRKGIDGVECYPTARLILATNNRPRFKDRSMGIWRRMLLVPFRYTVPLEQQDRHLTQKLQQELPGIFLWAIEGLKRLRANGHFTEPAACQAVLDEYRLESNPARVFLNENVAVVDGNALRCADLYTNYVAWSKQNGFEALNAAQFGKEVGKRFPTVKRTRMTKKNDRAWCYMGLVYQSHVSHELPGSSMTFKKAATFVEEHFQKPVCEVH